jgi:hypothetical protein
MRRHLQSRNVVTATGAWAKATSMLERGHAVFRLDLCHRFAPNLEMRGR